MSNFFAMYKPCRACTTNHPEVGIEHLNQYLNRNGAVVPVVESREHFFMCEARHAETAS